MLNNDDCSRGTECGVHYRISDHNIEAGTLIDYVGGMAIITQTVPDNVFALSMLVGTPVDAMTWVYRVGEGTLADIADDMDPHLSTKEKISVPLTEMTNGSSVSTRAESYIQYIIDAHKASVEVQQVLAGL